MECSEDNFHFLTKPTLLRFPASNPGFDSAIISPCIGKKNSIHITFFETRYSSNISGTREPISDFKVKQSIMRNIMTSFLDVIGARLKVERHYVYALYRDVNIPTKLLDVNTILLEKRNLTDFYGPSFEGLGIL